MTEARIAPTADQSGAEAAAGDRNEVSVLDLLIILAKHKKILLGLPLVVATITALVTVFMANIYTATAMILPPQQGQSTASMMLGQLGALSGLAGSPLQIRQPSDIYVAIIRSRSVADSMISRFHLMQEYKSKTLTGARNALRGATNIIANKDGTIIIEVDDKDPVRAATLANGYIDELYKLTQTVAVTEASQRRLFFEKQLHSSKDALANAEVELRKLQEATGMIKLEDQGRAMIESVAKMQAEVAAKEMHLAVMRTFATDQNPELVRAQLELVQMRAQLEKMQRENKLGAGSVVVPTSKLPQVGLDYVRKYRDVKYYETIFELLAKQFEAAKIDESRDASVIQVLDKAVPPEVKSKPKRTIIVVLATLVAALGAILLAFLKEASERACRNPHQAARLNALLSYIMSR
jgi:tyrosine-protein kinase Etk/Wzc